MYTQTHPYTTTHNDVHITTQNNTASKGSPLFAHAFAHLRVVGSTFERNTASGAGPFDCGIVMEADSRLDLISSHFNHPLTASDNAKATVCTTQSYYVVSECVFENGVTGGVFVVQSEGHVNNSVFHNQVADLGGLSAAEVQLAVNNCSFTANTASAHGPALQGSTVGLTLTGCVFEGNIANSSTVFVYNFNPTYPLVNLSLVVNDTLFRENGMVDLAGGLFVMNTPTHVTRCTFDGNEVRGVEGFGAAIVCASSPSMFVDNCTFVGLRGGIGSVACVQMDLCSISRAQFMNNSASGGECVWLLACCCVRLLSLELCVCVCMRAHTQGWTHTYLRTQTDTHNTHTHTTLTQL